LTSVHRARLFFDMSAAREGAVLVLGGSGFLGAHVVAAAGEAEHARSGPTRGAAEIVSAGRREPFVAVEGASGAARARWVAFDALHAGAVERLCDDVQPARAIVCTALSTIPECESYPGLARALNVDLPQSLARWCANHAARAILVSTDLVFGAVPPPATGFDESARVAPVSEYGRSKARGESAFLAAHPGALVVRLPLLFGDSGGRDLGASDRVIAACERGERVDAFEDEWRTPLDVASAARALVELAYADVSGILHVAGPERVSRYELARLALASRGFDRDEARAKLVRTTRAEAGMDVLRPADVSLDSSRARSLLRTRLLGPSDALVHAARARGASERH
jgi:dTDP-4-dehydrorhamnose reductase